MRCIVTADWQLGMTAHFLPEGARARFHQARLDAVRRIVDLAEERGADAILVGGDVFESNQLDRAIVARAFEVLRSSTVPVVLVPGNHDPLDAASIYDSPAFLEHQPEHVRVVRDAVPIRVAPGLEVVGAPWHAKRPVEDLVAAALAPLEPAPAGVARIVVGHGAVTTLSPDPTRPDTIGIEPLRAALAAGVCHAIVLGDRHSTTEVEPGIWYPGAPEVTARDEVDPGNVLVLDVDGAGHASVETVRVGRWSFRTIDDRVDGRADVDRLADRLRALPAKERTAVWLALSGTLSVADHAHLEDVLQEAGELFARIDHWQRHSDLVVLPDDLECTALGLDGFAGDAVDELVAIAQGDDARAATASDALGLLYRFTRTAA